MQNLVNTWLALSWVVTAADSPIWKTTGKHSRLLYINWMTIGSATDKSNCPSVLWPASRQAGVHIKREGFEVRTFHELRFQNAHHPFSFQCHTLSHKARVIRNMIFYISASQAFKSGSLLKMTLCWESSWLRAKSRERVGRWQAGRHWIWP